MLYFNIILFCLYGLLFLFLFLTFIIIKYRLHKLNKTTDIINNLGFMISLVAPIRTGKTSLMCGIKHLCESLIIENIENTIKEIKIILYYLDFNNIDNIIKDNIKSKNDFDFLTNLLIDKIQLLKHPLFDTLNYNNVYNLIYDYIYCFYCLNIRKNYVMSKTKCYSYITNNYNLNYNVENQKIIESYKQQNYIIEDYVVELIDESSDELGSSKYYSDIKEESGLKEYKRKYGHLHKERNRLILTKQDASDEIKKLRFLNNNEIKINKKVKVLKSFFIIDLIINIRLFIIKFNNVFINLIKYIYYLISNKQNDFYIKSENFFHFLDLKNNINFKLRKKLYFYNIFKNLLVFLFGFNKYNVSIYSSNKEIIQENKTNINNLYIPTRFCFGIYDNFEFRYIQLDLLKVSKEYSIEVLREESKDFKNDIEQLEKTNTKGIYYG